MVLPDGHTAACRQIIQQLMRVNEGKVCHNSLLFVFEISYGCFHIRDSLE